ncbi:DNA-binding transcriptional regulator, MarR family [Virgibacillus subterraneus]|uniref:DNA-binding transcriptional regulator, MarR family n=1 Tax=Virgibacillus subterraneus TaxID=621109 RepID=A0A1H8Z512_9BACI|nr:MarR family transcriptional regulator [Virgibacillus subterraneus]SEP59421.1 DNA-binding transcriptional regulator, MarR family [Virgibacillus subterraneus]
MKMDEFPQSSRQIAQLFREINAIMNQQLRKAFQGLGITPPQMMILHYLYKNKERKVSDISKHLNLAASTVSSILDRLERNELITRERNKDDKRVVLISLSNKAIEIKASLNMGISEFMEDMTQTASDEEVEKIINGLTLMKEVLNRNGLDDGGESHD